MNIKALLTSLRLRKFATTLLLLQLSLTIGLMVNTLILTTNSIENLNSPLGFDVKQLIAVDLRPTSNAFKNTDYYRAITEQDITKISALDGVVSAAPYNQLPIQVGGSTGTVVAADFPEDAALPDKLKEVPLFFSSKVGLKNLGIEIVEGRSLSDADDITTSYYSLKKSYKETNIILTQSLAKALFPGKSALGELTNRGRVVGIARDFTSTLDRQSCFALFANLMPLRSDYQQHYVIRVAPNKVAQVKAKLRDVILSVQPERDILLVQSMAQRLTKVYSQDTGLASLFAMLSLLMMIVTIVSSFAHAHFHVTQQRKFIGIRRALGARKKDIMIHVFSENWLLSFAASVFAIATTIGLNIILSQIITIEKPSCLLYLLAILIVFISGSLATWLPAYQTAKISPLTATKTV